MGLNRLLWEPLPDPLPAAGRHRRWLVRLVTTVTAPAPEPQLSPDAIVDRRVRRGILQALVREAYKLRTAQKSLDNAPRRSKSEEI